MPAIEFDFDALPARLTAREQWVCWREQERDGKLTKVPVDPTTGEHASTADDRTWASFDTARSYATSEATIAGIGFVFTTTDPFVGVDLDDCRDPDTGTLTERTQAIVRQLDSYTEVSPSGTGVHVLVTGDLPGQRTRAGDVEMYEQGRYFTMTGAHLSMTPATIEARDDALTDVYETHIQPEADDDLDGTGTAPSAAGNEGQAPQGEGQASRGEGQAPGGEGPPSNSETDVDRLDAALIERATNATNGDAFARLWEGSTAGYPSHSEADMALCMHLAFWTGGDRTWMDELFRQSGLMREKWDEVHTADGRTYGELTLAKALAKTDEFYDPSQIAAEERGAGDREGKTTPSTAPSGAVGSSVPDSSDDDMRDISGSEAPRSRAHLAEANRVLDARVAEQAETITEQRETIREQAARIDELEAEVTQLREILAEREAAIEDLEDTLAAAHTSVWRRLPAWLSGQTTDSER